MPIDEKNFIWFGNLKAYKKRFKLLKTTDKAFHDVIPKQTHLLLFVLLHSKLRTQNKEFVIILNSVKYSCIQL